MYDKKTDAYRLAIGKDSRYEDLALIFLCDHARNMLPARYGNLGLNARDLGLHIAYDPGALELSEGLSEYFSGSLLHSCFSRLLIDPNRGLDDPTLIMKISDNTLIRDNLDISSSERDLRIDNFYHPYNDAIAKLIAQKATAKPNIIIISIHSFTAIFNGSQRVMDAALLWEEEHKKWSSDFLKILRHHAKGKTIAANEPYTGGIKGSTLWRHCLNPLRRCLLIEYRQDNLRSHSERQFWLSATIGAIEDFIEQGLYLDKNITYQSAKNNL